MDADIEKLLREMWSDLSAQLRGRPDAPASPLERRELEKLQLEIPDVRHKTRLERIEERLARLERHVGLTPKD